MPPKPDIAEVLDQPRKRSASYYIVLLLLVLPVWSVVPLSWAFVAYALRTGTIWSFAWPGRFVFTIAFCEVGRAQHSPTLRDSTRVHLYHILGIF